MVATSAIFGVVVAGLVPALLAAPAPAPTEVDARGGGISVVDACHQQYGSQWGAAHSGSGAYDWYCVNSSNGITGGLDFNAYCKRTYGTASESRNRGGVWDWYCT